MGKRERMPRGTGREALDEWCDLPTVDLLRGTRRPRRPAPDRWAEAGWVAVNPCIVAALHETREVLSPRCHVVLDLAGRVSVRGTTRPLVAMLKWMLLDAAICAEAPEIEIVTRDCGVSAEIEVRVDTLRSGDAFARHGLHRQLASELGGDVTVTREEDMISYLLALPARVPLNGRAG